MSSSFNFKHIAIKVKILASCFWFSNKDSCFKNVWLLGLKFHDFRRQKQKRPENTVYLSTSTIFLVLCYSHAEPVAVHSNYFSVIWGTLRRESTPNWSCCIAKLCFVVFQSEVAENNSHDWLIKHVKETIVMKILKQFRTNVNYMAYMSDCMIEICNTHTITFG